MALVIGTNFKIKNRTSSHLPLSSAHFLKPSVFISATTNSRTHFPNYRFFTSQPRFFAATKINASFEELYGASLDQFNGNSNSTIAQVLPRWHEKLCIWFMLTRKALKHSYSKQRQKQLELILAIGKAVKLWETKCLKSQDQVVGASEASKSPDPNLAMQKECGSQAENAFQDDKTNFDPARSLHDDVATIGIDEMMSSNSTLQDFFRNCYDSSM